MSKDPGPEPSADCPRCHYFEHKKLAEADREITSAWPLGIDQAKALEILSAAFPDGYGGRKR